MNVRKQLVIIIYAIWRARQPAGAIARRGGRVWDMRPATSIVVNVVDPENNNVRETVSERR